MPRTSSTALPPRSCFVATCTIDHLDHLVPDEETNAAATRQRYRLEALCGHRVIPERDPASHRGIPCEGCYANAAMHNPALIIRGRPPVRITVPDTYVLVWCSLDLRAHLVPKRDWADTGDSVTTVQALGAHEIHPDGGPLTSCVELCGDCRVAWPEGTASRPSPTGPLLYRGSPR